MKITSWSSVYFFDRSKVFPNGQTLCISSDYNYNNFQSTEAVTFKPGLSFSREH